MGEINYSQMAKYSLLLFVVGQNDTTTAKMEVKIASGGNYYRQLNILSLYLILLCTFPNFKNLYYGNIKF